MQSTIIPSPSTTATGPYKLGLIGKGIGRSSAPRLHRLAGQLCGVKVTYELLDLEGVEEANLEAILYQCAEAGYRGVNVTYPFKEQAARFVEHTSPVVEQLGSVNTIVFAGNGVGKGYNTDYTGFLQAYQHSFSTEAPGAVGIVGTGGVGRSVAMALAHLGATELRLYDLDINKTQQLAVTIRKAIANVTVHVCTNLLETTAGVDGLVNCTPVGMWQHPGIPIPATSIQGQRWAFDVIYTPLKTEFLAAAQAKGLTVLSGYDLFFYQGMDAFKWFTNLEIQEEPLRAALRNED